MARSLVKTLLATAAIAAASVGMAGAASAAPVAGIVATHAVPGTSLTQSVRWVMRGHRRVWVADHPVRRPPPPRRR